MHKDYKQNYTMKDMFERGKRGQVTIFVIIAIALVVVIALAFFFIPDVRTVFSGEFSPQEFLADCVGQDLRSNIDLLASQGGYSNPEGFIVDQGVKIKYLCYTSQYYETCKIQQPLLKEQFEKELNQLIKPKANSCAAQLKQEYERRGYSVSSSSIDSEVELVPGKVSFNFVAPMTITKDTTQTFRNFEVDIDSQMYDLLLTATSIIDFESTYGDSETSLYIQYYPNLKIEKRKLGDGSKIYKITDIVSEESFTFASRSLAWPPGYGLE